MQNPDIRPSRKLTLRPWLVALMAFAVFFAAVSNHPAINVGDGSEYYAMEIAWADTHRPYMAEPAWRQYDALVHANEIAGLVPVDTLREFFPALRVGDTADFNHFWGYSLASAALLRISNSIGIGLHPHGAFLLLHSLLLAALVFFAMRWYGRAGVAAIALLVIASPILWYANKVHTEWPTFCLSTLAVMAAMKQRWAFAGLALALTSTQNISFALPAAFCSLLALVEAWKQRRLSVRESVWLFFSLVVVLLHPGYYFLRYGVITPQLLAGGASLHGDSFVASFNYLLDPDIGLLPNWPAGLILLAFSIAAFFSKPPISAGSFKFGSFIAVYILAALYATSANQNINSGGTAGVARYGLWYLCVFFPAAVHATYLLADRAASLTCKAGLITLLFVATVFNIANYRPSLGDSNTAPSPAAHWIYSHLPWLYSPNQEIFFERNSGLGEVAAIRPSIVLGPDCHKLLLLGLGTTAPQVLGNSLCGMDPTLVARHFSDARQFTLGDNYTSLSDTQIAAFRATALPRLLYGPATGPHSFQQFLGEGWGSIEPWGVWSVGNTAAVHIKLNNTNDAKVEFTLNAFLAGKHPEVTVTPILAGKPLAPFKIDASRPLPIVWTVNIPHAFLKSHEGLLDIEFRISSPASPAELGLSADGRKLGIGLVAMKVH